MEVEYAYEENRQQQSQRRKQEQLEQAQLGVDPKHVGREQEQLGEERFGEKRPLAAVLSTEK